jgi:hypothetical protein
MTNPWADHVAPSAGGDYYNLANAGDSFEATIETVAKAQPFTGEPECPRIHFTDGKHFDFCAFDAKRKVIELAPPIGSRIRVTRGTKVTGSRMIAYTVELVDNAKDRPAAAASKPATSNAAPF